MKAHILVLPLLLAALALSGCSGGSETPAEKAASENCPSFSARANGECGSVQDDEQAKHKEQVESEAHEAEAVIKHRAAEESANAIEGATK